MSQKPVRRGARRAQLPAVPGSDPTPQAVPKAVPKDADAPARAGEDTDRAWGDTPDDNDDRLKRDVPPHW